MTPLTLISGGPPRCHSFRPCSDNSSLPSFAALETKQRFQMILFPKSTLLESIEPQKRAYYSCRCGKMGLKKKVW